MSVSEDIELWFAINPDGPATDERQLLNDALDEIQRLTLLLVPCRADTDALVVECSKCGTSCSAMSSTICGGTVTLRVDPCSTCLDESLCRMRGVSEKFDRLEEAKLARQLMEAKAEIERLREQVQLLSTPDLFFKTRREAQQAGGGD